VEITRWPEKNRNAEGRIIEILGNEGEKGVDVMSIIRAYGIPYEFPDNVLQEVKTVERVLEDEYKQKRS
jgi:ribonuclease R